MTQRNRAVLIVLPLLVLAGVAVFLSGSHQASFADSRVKNPDAYLLDIKKMNGTDLHALELREGDVLQIQFETEKGNLYTAAIRHFSALTCNISACCSCTATC